MKKRYTAPWARPRPAGTRRTKLTAKNRSRAKASARRAGRRYPNLVDNMRAARKQKSKESSH